MKHLLLTLSLVLLVPFSMKAADYTADPDTLDFGDVWMPHELDGFSRESLVLHSCGMDDLVLQAIVLPDSVTDVILEELPDFPVTVSPGDSMELILTYAPDTPGVLETALTLYSNTSPAFTEVPIRGRAIHFADDPGTLFWQFTPPEEEPPDVIATLPIGDIDGDGIDDVFICRDNGHHFCVSGASSGEAVVLWESTTLIDGVAAVPSSRDHLFLVGNNEVLFISSEGAPEVFVLYGETGEIEEDRRGVELPEGEVTFVEQLDDSNVAVGVGNTVHTITWTGSWTIRIPSPALSGSACGVATNICYYITGGTIWETIPLAALFVQESSNTRVMLSFSDGLGYAYEETFYDELVIQAVNNPVEYRPCFTLSESGEIARWAPRSIYTPHFNEPPVVWATNPPADRIHFAASSNRQSEGVVVAMANSSHVASYGSGGNVLWSATFDGLTNVFTTGDWTGNTFEELVLPSQSNSLLLVDAATGDTTYYMETTAPVTDFRITMDLDHSGSREMLLGLADGSVICIGGVPLLDASVETHSAPNPTRYSLAPPWPNPFNASMTVRYEVPKAGQVRLELYNLLGQKVAVLDDGFHTPGVHQTVWQGGGLSSASSGTYFVRMQAEGFEQVRRVTLLK